jgi:muramidase (phage lysozyme)
VVTEEKEVSLKESFSPAAIIEETIDKVEQTYSQATGWLSEQFSEQKANLIEVKDELIEDAGRAYNSAAGWLSEQFEESKVKFIEIKDELTEEATGIFNNVKGWLSEQFLDSEQSEVRQEPKIADETSRITPLLNLIGDAEHNLDGKNYNTAFGNRVENFTDMSVDEVLSWQLGRLREGSYSSAVGRYQIIRKTLLGLKEEMGLSGEEKFDAEMQDRMAERLLERRGLNDFLQGSLTSSGFMSNLSQEWASLPGIDGRSHYHNDGVNKAQTTIPRVINTIENMRAYQPNA